MNLEKLKAITDIATAWIGVVAITAGGGFAVYQYLEKQKEDRVKETLLFLDRYNKTPTLEARLALDVGWEPYLDAQIKLLKAPDFSVAAYRGFMLAAIKEAKLAGSIDVMLDFYEALQICVEKKLCDGDVAVSFFVVDACATYSQNFSKIELERQRRNEPAYGLKLQQFCEAN
ncbi:hypothetical protein [Roseateles sp.]|uniref:hypothetical protein n=1 Tax=Roseateles sp. TaxID=1971397 RepID=UPI003BA9F5C3